MKRPCTIGVIKPENGGCLCREAANNQMTGHRKRIRQLEKELHRKEKALAETAALLALRKKLNALWDDSEED